MRPGPTHCLSSGSYSRIPFSDIYRMSVLSGWIRDPLLLLTTESRAGIRDKVFTDPSSQTNISENLVTMFYFKEREYNIFSPLLFFVVVRSGIRDPGCKKIHQDPGSGKNIQIRNTA
jgi:hypothetical protein